ncbi:hypothetical protein COK01_26805 [Priestia megaterium]|uniref:DUF3888 domain-containing protein n=1 Tax=Priestia megaterium TaxID=1404 RepID=UPI000BF6F0DA|nr:DUF3888 domain-containing protein [Priestia megaterium]PFP44698.1 hypothetical protein COK01_26805 [Priestia megaterium]
MKKNLCILSIITFIIFTFPINPKVEAVKPAVNEQYLQTSFLMLLDPYATKVINEKVGKDRSYSYFETQILSITKLEEGGYIVKVLYKTYTGPFNPPYGLETITFQIQSGSVKVIGFEHKKG